MQRQQPRTVVSGETKAIDYLTDHHPKRDLFVSSSFFQVLPVASDGHFICGWRRRKRCQRGGADER